MHKVMAVVFDPEQSRVEVSYTGEIFEFEVDEWFNAMDRLISEWESKHPMRYRTYGVDDLQIRAMSIMKVQEN